MGISFYPFKDAVISLFQICIDLSKDHILLKTGKKMKKYIISSTAAMNSPPPPPPKKKSRKGLIALIIIAIIVVAAAVGAYAVLNNGSNTGNNSTPTPGATSTPSPGSTSTPSPGSTSTPPPNGVASASSLQFSIDVTAGGVKQITSTYMAKNAGTNNLMLRIETTDTSGTTSLYIVNGALQKAWIYDGTEWTDISEAYSTQFSTWDASFTGYQNSLSGWAGVGGWTYAAPNGDSVRYYDISVNPNLPDSLFEHS
jgi:hypothetical protein